MKKSIITIFSLYLFVACKPIHDPYNASNSSTQGTQLLADPAIEADAIQMLTITCGACHIGASGFGGITKINDPEYLINTGLIVPGDPTQGRLIGAIEEGSMPQGSTMPAEDLILLKD